MTQDDENAMTQQGHDTIEVVEERASVRKEQIVSGGVRVETRTEAETEMVPVSLAHQDVEVRHIPVNKVVEKVPPVREENGVTIVPVVHERAVIRTELVLVEEVHIQKADSTEEVEIPVTLRKQHAIETRLDADDVPASDHD